MEAVNPTGSAVEIPNQLHVTISQHHDTPTVSQANNLYYTEKIHEIQVMYAVADLRQVASDETAKPSLFAHTTDP